MFRLFTSFLLLFPVCLFAQKNDYNWVLDGNLNLKFPEKEIKVFKDFFCKKESFYSRASCMSNKKGELIFYMFNCQSSDTAFIANSKNEKITDGSGIKILSSTYNTTVCNIPINDSIVYIIHKDYNREAIGNLSVSYLYETKLLVQDTAILILNKNKLICKNILSDKISAVRHTNQKDWWIIVNGGLELDTFFIYIANEKEIKLYNIETIGTKSQQNDPNFIIGTFGESCFSEQGDKLLLVNDIGVIDLFDFDRCTGTISNHIPLGRNTLHWDVKKEISYIGCSFSPDGTKAYVSDSQGNLYQYNLLAPDIKKSKVTIHSRNSYDLYLGQHQLAPDGKIYISTPPSFAYTHSSFAAIQQPNLAGKACQFDTSVITIQGVRTGLTLPNFPNFRIADPITALAGKDTVLCAGESLRLGQNVRDPKLIYEWSPKEGLDDPGSPNPLAIPTQTTAYVLTVRPQSSVPEACRSKALHSDTVLIQVIEKHVPPCTSVSRPELPKPFFKVYPNPASDFVQFHYQMKETDFAQVDVYNIQGIKVKSLELVSQDTELNLPLKDLTAGTYICKITVNGSAYNTFKLIVE
jgi:hypothetical protein